MVSYLEETVYHVVLTGLRDRELQEACTTQALLGIITNISPAVPTAIRFSPSSTHQSPARLALLQPPPTNISHTFCGTVRDEIRKGKEIEEIEKIGRKRKEKVYNFDFGVKNNE